MLKLQLQASAASVAAATSRETAAAAREEASSARERATSTALEAAWADLVQLRQELAQRDDAVSALTGLGAEEPTTKRHRSR